MPNTYSSAFCTILSSLKNRGKNQTSRTGDCIALKDQVYVVSLHENVPMPVSRGLSAEFASSFASSLLLGEDDGASIVDLPPQARGFLEPDAKLPDNICNTYGPKIKQQLDFIVAQLGNADTRRAYMSILGVHDYMIAKHGSKVEYPCTIGYGFYIEDNTLFMQTLMRSQNLGLMLLDCYIQQRIAKQIAQSKGAELGDNTVTVLDMHFQTDAWPLLNAMQGELFDKGWEEQSAKQKPRNNAGS